MSSSPSSLLTDRALVDRVLSGEQQAFTLVVRQTESLVAKIICTIVTAPEDRRDVVQDTYVKVYHKLHTFNFQARLSTWIGQIAYHTAINFLRKRRLVFPGTIETMPIIDEQPDAETLASQQEMIRLVEHKMQKLPAMYQLLLRLYHQQELSYSEIIDITGMPEGTVKNYLFRARKALKQQILSTYTKKSL